MRNDRRNWQKRRKKKKKDNENWTRTHLGARKILTGLRKRGPLNEGPEEGLFFALSGAKGERASDSPVLHSPMLT